MTYPEQTGNELASCSIIEDKNFFDCDLTPFRVANGIPANQKIQAIPTAITGRLGTAHYHVSKWTKDGPVLRSKLKKMLSKEMGTLEKTATTDLAKLIRLKSVEVT